MRKLFVIWHRWFGLTAAAFLFLSGITGTIIAWHEELDVWLNPQLYEAATAGDGQGAVELAGRFEASHPDLFVSWLPLHRETGQSQQIRVAPRAGSKAQPAYDQAWLDPVSGEIQGQRRWGAFAFSRENLIPFLYKFHYTLTLPRIGQIDTGMWLMGLIALAWIPDCFVALWLAFPKLANWRQSFTFRLRERGFRMIFDLHRSTSVWAWALLLIVAVSAVCLNLPVLTQRVVSVFQEPTPRPFMRTLPKMAERSLLSRNELLAIAEATAKARGWKQPAGGIYHLPRRGLYGVGFFGPGEDNGGYGMGNPWIYIDDHDGSVIRVVEPGQGKAADIFLQAQFPLHSGRLIGLPGRILISLLGIAVAVVSVTGVLIWNRKRSARLAKARQGGMAKPAVQAG